MATSKWTKNLTELLQKIGQETHTLTNDGEPRTKDEALIRLLWDTALGYEEVTIDDKGKQKLVKHRPQKWALELIYSRREGGIAGATPDEGGRRTAAEEVRELSKSRLNKLAKQADDNGE